MRKLGSIGLLEAELLIFENLSFFQNYDIIFIAKLGLGRLKKDIAEAGLFDVSQNPPENH